MQRVYKVHTAQNALTFTTMRNALRMVHRFQAHRHIYGSKQIYVTSHIGDPEQCADYWS